MLLTRVQDLCRTARETGLHRQRRMAADVVPRMNFSCNDYLSLSSDPAIKHAYEVGVMRYAVGSGGSPLASGYHPNHQALEQAFAQALRVDDAIFFSSGYVANLCLMALLSQLEVDALVDKAVHASIYDGMRLASNRFKRYRQCDRDDLQAKLKAMPTSSVVVTESVFSMSGQIAPLTDFVACGLDLMVDEAHAFGVMGPEGMGLIPEMGLTQQAVPLRVIPLGKAFAGSGAVVAGQADWIEALVQTARAYRYSTAPSPALAYGLTHTLTFVRAADDRRRKLAQLIDYFRTVAQRSPWTWRDSHTLIQQLQVGCPHQAQALSAQLRSKGVYCIPMREPTVPKQETGLRVILNYYHEPEDIDYLFTCLEAS